MRPHTLPGKWKNSYGERGRRSWPTNAPTPSCGNPSQNTPARFPLTRNPNSPALLTRDDGETLLYARRFNSIFGEPGGGKSWVALMAIIAAIRENGRVVLWDFEDRPQTTAERLHAMGASDVAESPNLVYVTPGMAEDELAMLDLAKWLNNPGPGLIVIDSAEAAGAPSDGAPVLLWLEQFVNRFLRKNIGVLVVDHVAKRREDRPKGQIGSQRKLAAVDGAALYVSGQVWSKSTAGTIRLRVDKDRPGDLPSRAGKVAAEIKGTPDGNGGLTYAIGVMEETTEDADPTFGILQALSDAQPQGVRTHRKLREAVKGRSKDIQAAIEDLLEWRWIVKSKDGRAFIFAITQAGLTALEGEE